MKKTKETKNNFYPLLCWDIFYNEYISRIKGLESKTKGLTVKSCARDRVVCNKNKRNYE